MISYAGIGARQTPSDVIRVMKQTAILLAKDGYMCNTGAAKGADQAFAIGADIAHGALHLCLPWGSYEEDWVKSLSKYTYTVLAEYLHKDAFESVYKYHPNPAGLKRSVVCLHARNFLIVKGVQFVVCWTPRGEVIGGTGQALRIVQDMGNIPIYNLGNPETRLAFEIKIEEREKELSDYVFNGR